MAFEDQTMTCQAPFPEFCFLATWVWESPLPPTPGQHQNVPFVILWPPLTCPFLFSSSPWASSPSWRSSVCSPRPPTPHSRQPYMTTTWASPITSSNPREERAKGLRPTLSSSTMQALWVLSCGHLLAAVSSSYYGSWHTFPEASCL